MDIDDDYERRGNSDIEVCTYTIHFGRGMWQESSSDAILKDIERTYGAKTARALAKYCELKKIDIYKVISDTKEDGNGMTEWDKFDVWAKKVKNVDIMGNFDDSIDWTGAEDERKREKELAKDEKLAARKSKRIRKGKPSKSGRFGRVHSAPTDFSTIDESTGGMDAQNIADFCSEELGECEWVSLIKQGDNADFEVTTTKGDKFKVVVTEV